MKKLHTQLAILAAIGAARFPNLAFRNDANPEAELKKVNMALEKISGELKTFAENSDKEIAKHGNLTAETKLAVDKLIIDKQSLTDKQAEILNRLSDIEQKIAKPANNHNGRILSLGQRFIDSEDFKAQFKNGAHGKFSHNQTIIMPMNAITSDSGSGGALVDPQRVGAVVGPTRALKVKNLINWGKTTSGSIEFPKEATFTNNADTVSDNPANGKPQSNLTYTLESERVATIAHFIKASKQVLEDASMLQGMIDVRLRYGVLAKEEDQLMKGSGTGQELHGLFTQAVSYSRPTGVTVVGETIIDRIRLALLQVELADYMGDGITINPVDWASIELLKDSQNAYLFANPHGLTAPMLWGKPLVSTKSLDANEFLVGAFQTAVMGWMREDVTVSVSNSDQDDFTKNMITILAEQREALTVWQNAAFVKGDFTDLIPS